MKQMLDFRREGFISSGHPLSQTRALVTTASLDDTKMTSPLRYIMRAQLALLFSWGLCSSASAQEPAPQAAPAPAPQAAPALAPQAAPAPAPQAAPASEPLMSVPPKATKTDRAQKIKKIKGLKDARAAKSKAKPVQVPVSEGCPNTNLLADLKPVLPTSAVERSLRLTDGETVKEGTSWNVVEAMIIKTGGRVTYDLGRSVPLSAFMVQGDNNDSYEVYGAQDDKRFSLLWKAGAVSGAGLRARAERLAKVTAPVRYVQLRASGGDKSYSASELQAFCATPEAWPPKTSEISATRQKSSKDARKHFIGRAKVGVGLFGLLIFFVPKLLRRREEPSVARGEGEDDEGEGEGDEGSKPQPKVEPESTESSTAKQGWSRWLPSLNPDREAMVIFSAISGVAATAGALWLGVSQLLDAYQAWVDNGLINQINGYFPVVFDGLDHQEIAFLNGAVLSVFGLLSLAYVLRRVLKLNLEEEQSCEQLSASFQTLGFIGLIWVVMTQADELLGKTSAWWPEGWEGLVIAPVLSLILIGLHLARRPRAARSFGWLSALLLGLMTWVSLGSFHGHRITHFWDSFHYYVGSKYFAENRYHLIYHCTLLAERDDGREEKLKGRPLRNLVDNVMSKADEVLDDNNEMVKECRAHFSPERWEAFKQDTRLFRSYMGESWWSKMFKDHGYNATPVWTFVGSLISQRDWASKVPPKELVYTPKKRNGRSSKQLKEARKRFYDEDRPRFEKEIIALNFIDLTLYALMFLLFLWAFGLETTAFIAVVFAIGYPWSYDWTGGSFGRIPWLFTAVSGLCFLKRGLPFLGGFALGWSLLLRVFPGAVLGGAALQIALMIIKRDPWTQTYKRFTYGGLTSLALLLPLGLVTGQGVSEDYQGVSVYKEFISNSMKHKDTPLTNNMGYPTILAFHPSYTVGRSNVLQRRIEAKTKEKKLPFSFWKTKHRELKKSRAPFQLLTLLGMFAFLYVMRKRWSIWEMTAASSVFIFLIFELTCYYYSFLVLLAPLAYQRARDIFGLLTIGVASQIIQIRIGATDIEYFWESIFVLAPMLLFVLGRLYEHLQSRGDEGQGEPESLENAAGAST